MVQEITISKGSKLALITAYAQGYYSGKEVYGEMFLPLEIYNKYRCELSRLEIYVYEIDGKHSCTECNIETYIDNVENFFEAQENKIRDISEDVLNDFIHQIEKDNNDNEEILQSLKKLKIHIFSLNNLLQSYRKLGESKTHTFTKDCEIDGINIKQGTQISWKDNFVYPDELKITFGKSVNQ